MCRHILHKILCIFYRVRLNKIVIILQMCTSYFIMLYDHHLLNTFSKTINRDVIFDRVKQTYYVYAYL